MAELRVFERRWRRRRWREDLPHYTVAAYLHNIYRKAASPAVTPIDLMPQPAAPEAEAQQETLAKVIQLNRFFGGRDLRPAPEASS